MILIKSERTGKTYRLKKTDFHEGLFCAVFGGLVPALMFIFGI